MCYTSDCVGFVTEVRFFFRQTSPQLPHALGQLSSSPTADACVCLSAICQDFEATATDCRMSRRQKLHQTDTVHGCQTARHRVPEGKSSTGRKNTSASSILTTRKHEKLANTRLPSIGFRNWSRFLAVSLQVTWIVNPAVGCHYFLPGLQLPPQPLRRLLPILLLGEQRLNWCKQFA